MRFRRARALVGLAVLAALLSPSGCRRDDPKALGIELLPVEDSPYVAVRVVLEVGSAFDPPGKEGLCRLALSLMADGGSRTRTSAQAAAALAGLGTDLRFEVGREASAFSATVLRQDLDAFYTILRELLLEPGMRESDFERLKEAQLGLLREAPAGGRDDGLAAAVLAGMMREGLAGPHPAAGSIDTVSSITLDEAVDFRREHFVRGNVTIGLAGGYPAAFPGRVREDFLALPAAFTPRLPLRAPRLPDESRALLIERPGREAAAAIGRPVPLTPADEGYQALAIAAADLAGWEPGTEASVGAPAAGLEAQTGSRPPSRLNVFSLSFRSAGQGQALDKLGRIVARIRFLAEEGLPPERFTLLRDGLLRSLGLRGGTLADRLARRMAARAAGGEDDLEAAARILPGLSANDVRDAVGKHLPADRLFIAFVSGRADAARDALAAGPLRLRADAAPDVSAAEWFRIGAAAPIDAAKADRVE